MVARLETQRAMSGDRWPLIETFMGDPARWLPEPAQPCPPEAWRITLKGGPTTRVVVAHVGEPWTLPEAFVRPVKWQLVAGHGELQHSSRLVPEFDGRLTLAFCEELATLDLSGQYQPPGGKVGAAADSVVLHRIAHGTIQALLDHVAERIEQLAGAVAR